MEHEKSMHRKWRKMFFIVFFVLNFLLIVYVAFFKRDSLWLETLKVGGSDNMQLVQQLYKSDSYKMQQKQAIQQVIDSMQAGAAQQPTVTDTSDTTTQPQANANTIDLTTLATIKKNAFINGNVNARVTVLVYSEFLCPYCKRQEDNKISEQLLKKYGNDVNIIFRNYIVHPQAEKLAEAGNCIGELAGAKAYYLFIPKMFALEDKTDAAILDLAKSLGAKSAAFTKCLDSWKYATDITNSTAEGKNLFGVTGTPGNVIVDNEKGTYTLIAGAYPLDTFTAAIDAILK